MTPELVGTFLVGAFFGASIAALAAGLCTWKALDVLRNRHERERRESEVRRVSLPEGWLVTGRRKAS